MEEILLFASKEIASHIAFSLRGTWDGCNGVNFSSIDELDLMEHFKHITITLNKGKIK